MREAGDVCFADVFKDGTGVVEFLRYEDMKYAVKKLDDSRFRSHEVRMKKEQMTVRTASNVSFCLVNDTGSTYCYFVCNNDQAWLFLKLCLHFQSGFENKFLSKEF